MGQSEKELLKEAIKLIHRGESIESIKAKYGDLLQKVNPVEIPVIEQELVREGLPIQDILKLCDLHVELFRSALEAKELRNVPRGHPLSNLLRENEHILRNAEGLAVLSQALLKGNEEERRRILDSLKRYISELKKIRIHYRKNQMILFPYLERRGINAIPRVLWGREDQAIVKIRELEKLLEQDSEKSLEKIASLSLEISREIADLVFRENKILYPTLWSLLSDGEWAAIAQLSQELGYVVSPEVDVWRTEEEPIFPYQLSEDGGKVVLEKLPPEVRGLVESAVFESFDVKREGDIELRTGFLSRDQLEGIFDSIPLELTFADSNDRIKFFSKSRYMGGFPRSKSIIGRRLEFCHPPRLENYVRLNVNLLKEGKLPYREFWTRSGDRILRVIVAGIRGRDNEYLGTLEIVEDFTEVLKNPEEIVKKIVVL
ncbi:MAG: DUF438 domain-containing protein [Fervidicoccaceae archaeon]